MKEKTIVQLHQKNFETLRQAFAAGQVALVECTDCKTLELVAVICAMYQDPQTGEITMTPFARFFNGNPFEMLLSPQERDAMPLGDNCYRIQWRIDIEAGNPQAAARQALAIQRDPESTATVFEVRNAKTGKVEEVDLR